MNFVPTALDLNTKHLRILQRSEKNFRIAQEELVSDHFVQDRFKGQAELFDKNSHFPRMTA